MARPALPPDVLNLITATAEAAAEALVSKLSCEPRDPLLTPSRLMTVKETCAYLNCSRATLRRLEEAGALIPKRFGRKVLYSHPDLQAYIQQADTS